MRFRAALLALLTACSSPTTPSDALDVGAPPPPSLDPASVERGQQIYDASCAVCHGAALEGAADWKTPTASGNYPPPPHDSTGHTWHHSDQVLAAIISDPASYGLAMPPLGLNASEISAVLDYLKSNWGPEERRFQWERTYGETNRSDGDG